MPNKITSALLAASLSSILMWLAHQYGHVDIPAEIASSITTLLTFFVHSVVPEVDMSDNVVVTENPTQTQEIKS